IKSPNSAEGELPFIADRLAALPDPRDRRGRRHPLATVLLTAACAVPNQPTPHRDPLSPLLGWCVHNSQRGNRTVNAKKVSRI
ncbi:hypothetical protein K8369_37600, partial [Streptomyces sp. PSKA30]|nr:hypothetical protein [Streptomyces sp. PSKA30]